MQGNAAMSDRPTKEHFDFLRSIDTPTVCNLIEMVVPARRGSGYTVKHLHCPFPDLPPMVGFAKTVTIMAKAAFGTGDQSSMQRRLEIMPTVDATTETPATAVTRGSSGEGLTFAALQNASIQGGEPSRAGVPPGEQELIFDRFWRGKGAASVGAGLGLASVKETMNVHRGSVTVDAGPTGGTIFTLHFATAAGQGLSS
jgi:hypothetical protein